jgi:hypothetical protein
MSSRHEFWNPEALWTVATFRIASETRTEIGPTDAWSK